MIDLLETSVTILLRLQTCEIVQLLMILECEEIIFMILSEIIFLADQRLGSRSHWSYETGARL